MACNGNWFGSLFILAALLSTQRAEAFGGHRMIQAQQGCGAQVQLAASWDDLSDYFGGCQELVAGSYEGKGEVSGETYLLHLIPYYQQPGAFIALVMTDGGDASHASVGFVQQRSFGSYSWFGIRAESGRELAPAMDAEPMGVLALELSAYGELERITLTSIHVLGQSSHGAERIVFSEARRSLMRREIPPGYWQYTEDSVNALTTTRSNDFATNRSWNVQWDKNGMNHQGVIREELPGTYALRLSHRANYASTVDEGIATLIFPVNIWSNDFLGIGSYKRSLVLVPLLTNGFPLPVPEIYRTGER